MKNLESNLIEKKVLIVGNHRFAGSTGVVERIEFVKPLDEYGLVIRLDESYDQTFVFDSKQLKIKK